MTAIKPQANKNTGGVSETGMSTNDKNLNHVYQLLDESGNHLASFTQQQAYQYLTDNQYTVNIKNALGSSAGRIITKGAGANKSYYQVAVEVISQKGLNNTSSIDKILSAFADYPDIRNDAGFMFNYFGAQMSGVMNYKKAQALGLNRAPEQSNNNQPSVNQSNNITIKYTNGR
jgi:hypothetical protein